MQNGNFPCKNALHFKKVIVCYKLSLCEYCQLYGMAFTVLSNCAKMVGGGRPLLPQILAETDPPLQKR